MPKGVEHSPLMSFIAAGCTVSSSVMPKGVEHENSCCGPIRPLKVSSSVMPKGVEHSCFGLNTSKGRRCVEFSDAERR